jgi:hypothetical protein
LQCRAADAIRTKYVTLEAVKYEMQLAAMQHPHSTLINGSIFITHSAITWRQCRKPVTLHTSRQCRHKPNYSYFEAITGVLLFSLQT